MSEGVQVIFYHNAADRIASACEMVSRAYHAGHKVLVLSASDQEAAAVDRRLWTTPPTAFIPHCLVRQPLAGRTPVLIATALADAGDLRAQVLVNLQSQVPSGYESFDQVVEVVDQDAARMAQARERFRFYRQNGHPPEAVDMTHA